MTEHVIPLSFATPPLTLNTHMHHMARARLVKAIRHEAFTSARAMRLGPYKHITVQLHYQPSVSRTRDRSNLFGTQKPLLDGLVDAGVVPGDDSRYVTEHIPMIHPVNRDKPAECWLAITTP